MSRLLRAIVILVLILGWSGPAAAQVPPHVPGTICFTPQFWCWAPQPGSPGSACSCPTVYGWVSGMLG